MTETTNLHLNLIEDTDLIDNAPFNENANILDSAINTLQGQTASIPTLQTTVAEQSSAISGLSASLSADEITLAGHTNAIASINNTIDQQSTAITANTNAIETANTNIEAIDEKVGDLIVKSGNNYTTPEIVKKVTFCGDISYDQNGNALLILPTAYLPTTYTNFYVNASIYNKGGDTQTRATFYMNRAYISTMGGLNIEFQSITNGIDPTESYDGLQQPQTNNLVGYAEIIFV